MIFDVGLFAAFSRRRNDANVASFPAAERCAMVIYGVTSFTAA
jgi:hypothetical protein